MWNTSTELDWDQHVAPVCSDYCGRLYAAGYSEQYRKNVVKHAVNIWDKKIHDNDTGVSPLNRPKGYRKLERRKEKKEKKKNWTTKGGYCAPIIVPATPGGVLCKMLQEIADAEPNIKFKVVEKGGLTLEKMLARPNPTASGGCGREDCAGCKQEGGINNCQKCGCMYSYTCSEPDCNYKYIGESHNNFLTRSKQHTSKYNSKDPKVRDGSFIYKHQIEHHNGREPNMKLKVEKTFQDNLTRQITESVHIFRTEQQTKFKLMNTKSEWHAPSLYNVRREIGHG